MKPKIEPCPACESTGWICSQRYAHEQEVVACTADIDGWWWTTLACNHDVSTNRRLGVGMLYPCYKCVEETATRANHPPKE